MPGVLQAVDPFMSETDIEKGERWADRLATELENTNFGVVCLTPDNRDAPWLHFEAGALAKMISGKARLAPLLFDLTPSDVHGPLAGFQCVLCQRDHVKEMLRSINDAAGNTDQRFLPAFEALWEKLDSSVQTILGKYRANWG